MKVYIVKSYWNGADWDSKEESEVCIVDSEEKAKAKINELADTIEEREWIKVHHIDKSEKDIILYLDEDEEEYQEYWYYEKEIE